MRYKTVLLFGAPGSGKGTQGRILGSVPGFFHCACGDVFRSLDLHSETGRQFSAYASRGELVPDEFTVDLWRQTIRGTEMINRFHPETEILVLDGLPRNVHQAEMLADTLDVVRVIHLACDDPAKMVERLKRRALKENRFDDARDDVIRRRLAVFDAETKLVLDCFPSDRVVRVDATQSQIAVLSDILQILSPVLEQVRLDAAIATKQQASTPELVDSRR